MFINLSVVLFIIQVFVVAPLILEYVFKFGWDSSANGWSLAAIGVVSVFVQGYLLGKLLKKFPPPRLAVMGLTSSMLAYAAWGAAPAGWVMYAVIFANMLGFTVSSSIQSIVSSAADDRSQGRTLGSVSALNSLTAVMGPLIATPLLVSVSHLPQGHWEIGAPLYCGALLQALALLLAWSHFRRVGFQSLPAGAAAGGTH